MPEQVEGLKVWQKGITLVKDIYRVTSDCPKEEQYGLTSQMRRASVSIPANIAEGKGRFHKREFVQFLFIARGSAYELVTLLEIAREPGFLQSQQVFGLKSLCAEIMAMLNGLVKSVK